MPFLHVTPMAECSGCAYIAAMAQDTALTLGEGIKRGLRRHCPHCDRPTLFKGYLAVEPTCPNCGADNGRNRVDDIASYVTVLVVGHLIVAPSLALPFIWTMPLWVSMTVLLLAVAGVTLAALPFVKGGVIGALAATGAKEAGSRF